MATAIAVENFMYSSAIQTILLTQISLGLSTKEQVVAFRLSTGVPPSSAASHERLIEVMGFLLTDYILFENPYDLA